MKIEVLVRKYIIDKAKDFTFDRVSGCAPFIGGRGEYIQAARMRKTKGHCLDLQCELRQRLRLPGWGADVLVNEEWGGDLWTWMACVIFCGCFLCVGVCIMWCVVIACGNSFLVDRRIFAKEGWHYDTWLAVMSEDFT